jgi:hypothetical protein
MIAIHKHFNLKVRHIMFVESIPEAFAPHHSALSRLSLQDFLDDRYSDFLTPYLSLSIAQLEGYIRIRLSTTGQPPLTYSTLVPCGVSVDTRALVFARDTENTV